MGFLKNAIHLPMLPRGSHKVHSPAAHGAGYIARPQRELETERFRKKLVDIGINK